MGAPRTFFTQHIGEVSSHKSKVSRWFHAALDRETMSKAREGASAC